MRAIILAAGRGERNFPYDLPRQKAALPVGNDALACWTVRWLKSAGIEVQKIEQDRISLLVRDDSDLLYFWRAAADRGIEIRHLNREIATLEDAVVDVMEQNMVRNNV